MGSTKTVRPLLRMNFSTSSLLYLPKGIFLLFPIADTINCYFAYLLLFSPVDDFLQRNSVILSVSEREGSKRWLSCCLRGIAAMRSFASGYAQDDIKSLCYLLLINRSIFINYNFFILFRFTGVAENRML